jgi:hypothetical protein
MKGCGGFLSLPGGEGRRTRQREPGWGQICADSPPGPPRCSGHPPLRGRDNAGAAANAITAAVVKARPSAGLGALPLPLAGEGWGEGETASRESKRPPHPPRASPLPPRSGGEGSGVGGSVLVEIKPPPGPPLRLDHPPRRFAGGGITRGRVLIRQLQRERCRKIKTTPASARRAAGRRTPRRR